MGGKNDKSKINKYADKVQVEAEFDFHGIGILLEADIINLLNKFLEQSLNGGLKRLLIITGKGLHSDEGVSKIKPIVLRELSKKSFVKNFNLARRDRGGDGAIEVFLI